MPKQTSSGKLQLNISVQPEVYTLLQRYAPTRRAYGTFLGNLLTAYVAQHGRDELRERVERLEHYLALPSAGAE